MNRSEPTAISALFLLLGALVATNAQTPVHSSIGFDGTNGSNRITLTWEAVPTKLYHIRTTTALGQQPWQNFTPAPLYAFNNLIRFHDTNNQPARFYQVVKLDTDPPEIWRLNPGSNAVAVARQSVLKAYLRDETAIDPASIILTVGTNPPSTLADPRLAFINNVLTYTPATNEFIGTNGQTITTKLIVADTLGQRTTNTWPFKLELIPILASNVVLVSASSAITLVSTNGDTYVFSYTGASSGLINGQIIVSTDASNPYKRTVLSLTDNPGAHTVSLVTTQAALADILLQGSVRFQGGAFVPDGSGFQPASGSGGITIDLGGQTLYNENNVTIQTVSGRLLFDPEFSISAEFRSPRTFDLDIAAHIKFDMALQASWQNTGPFSGEQPIGSPIRQFQLIYIPIPFLPAPMPVLVETVWEFYLGTEGEVAGQASLTVGFDSTSDLACGVRLRDGQWTLYKSENTRPVGYPPTWQGGGSARIQGYVEPRLTVYLDHLIGPTANVRPYLELVANACVQPGHVGVDASLYNGINGTLALAIRGWEEDWGTLPSYELFNVRSVNPLLHRSFTTPVGTPPQASGNMVWIPCGTFTMGSPASEPARLLSEGPQTEVTFSKGFWMGRYEVTQGEYLEVIGSNPSYFIGASHGTDLSRPVEKVSWFDCVAYCAVLTTRERNAGRLPAGYLYRLPTEAEWEYACRAGTTTAYRYGDALRSGMANFNGLSEYPPCGGQLDYCYNPSGTALGRTTGVGSYAPNAWGLYDMHGNVLEWCSDWWSSSLPGGNVTDPQGVPTGSYRVLRGGGWCGYAFYCRSAGRGYGDPGARGNFVGFRVVLVPGQ